MRALERFQRVAYDLLRFFAGAMFSVHGIQKVFGVMATPRSAAFTQVWVGGVIELVCGILLYLATRGSGRFGLDAMRSHR